MMKYICLLYDLHLILIGLVLIYMGIEYNVSAETLSMQGFLECYAGGAMIGWNIMELFFDIRTFFFDK